MPFICSHRLHFYFRPSPSLLLLFPQQSVDENEWTSLKSQISVHLFFFCFVMVVLLLLLLLIFFLTHIKTNPSTTLKRKPKHKRKHRHRLNTFHLSSHRNEFYCCSAVQCSAIQSNPNHLFFFFAFCLVSYRPSLHLFGRPLDLVFFVPAQENQEKKRKENEGTGSKEGGK